MGQGVNKLPEFLISFEVNFDNTFITAKNLRREFFGICFY